MDPILRYTKLDEMADKQEQFTTSTTSVGTKSDRKEIVMHDGKPCKGKRGKKSMKKSLPKRGQRLQRASEDSSVANEPTDKALYARVKAAAKKKFKVYPSAYANAWLVREYEAWR